MLRESFRVYLDPEHHIMVDVERCEFDAVEQEWRVGARCQLWRGAAIGSQREALGVELLGARIEVEVRALSVDAALQCLAHIAPMRCLGEIAR